MSKRAISFWYPAKLITTNNTGTSARNIWKFLPEPDLGEYGEMNTLALVSNTNILELEMVSRHRGPKQLSFLGL